MSDRSHWAATLRKCMLKPADPDAPYNAAPESVGCVAQLGKPVVTAVSKSASVIDPRKSAQADVPHEAGERSG